MKELSFYKERANALLVETNRIQEAGSCSSIGNLNLDNCYPEINSVIMDFTHLVYAFDPNLPLNKYIEKLENLSFKSPFSGDYTRHNQSQFDEIRYYIDYFIKYIDDYAS